ncbi:porin [Cupriavidus taiwanensis]|uniref:Outer membrane protein (Porin) n=1 Tax=Cupriavidus taiwanensis TaxID=164546 RepID=A0A7Z7JIY1_9BURK|nr:porin [Cupriavidus taiwanensis]SOZ19474.1 Outer membrane protein (Porin) [Cupriavidus taiwanensis]SOZ97272.1 Outer membrane protein (Porin) [Cupriavidus taiwanensis]SPC26162.1 Outer membrane protein (Porin) [Cupriavidus taiwanensis]SPD37704.1 Outer membrane protein (Porin) [Cupriavidus taiwanensis]
MQYKPGATALFCALCSLPAAAQTSVTLYGVVDAGIEFANHQNGGDHSVVRMTSGNVAGSRWGLRGMEDLGGGLKGVFVLESGYDTDTGKSAQGGRLFGRMAYVGLQGKWGSLLLGRQQTALFDVIGRYDPMLLATKYSIFTQDVAFVSRADNTIKYTGTFGGLVASAMYSFGAESGTANGSEVPGEPKLGREYGFRLSYSSGPFSVGAAYDDVNTGTVTANPDAKTRRAVLAGTYELSPVKVFAGYRWAKAYDGALLTGAIPGQANQGSNLWWTGVTWQAGAAINLSAAAYYQDFRNTGNDPWLFVGMAKYAFSKRTDAYLSVGYTKNKGSSNLGLSTGGSGFGTTTAGTNQFGTTIGLRHIF